MLAKMGTLKQDIKETDKPWSIALIRDYPKANTNSLSNYFSTIYDINAAGCTMQMTLTEYRTITKEQNRHPSTTLKGVQSDRSSNTDY